MTPDIFLYGPPLAPPVEYLRWTLARMGITCRFEPAAAGISALRSWRKGVPIEPPLLTIGDEPHGGFKAVFGLLHGSIAEGGPRPVPAPDVALAEVLFADLFTQSVRLFYRPLLPRRDLLAPIAAHGVPAMQRGVIRYLYPLWRTMLWKGLDLDAHDAEADYNSVLSAFEQVGRRLGEAPFLDGERPGSNDVFFAVVASPVTLPPGHPQPLPALQSLPEPLGDQVRALRDLPAGRLVLRTYEWRNSLDI